MLPAFVTVKVWPAIVKVPVRGPCGLAATTNVTVPLFDPLPPPVITIQGALLTAVHAQLLTTETAPVPAPVENDRAVVVMPYSSHSVAMSPMLVTGRPK